MSFSRKIGLALLFGLLWVVLGLFVDTETLIAVVGASLLVEIMDRGEPLKENTY